MKKDGYRQLTKKEIKAMKINLTIYENGDFSLWGKVDNKKGERWLLDGSEMSNTDNPDEVGIIRLGTLGVCPISFHYDEENNCLVLMKKVNRKRKTTTKQ